MTVRAAVPILACVLLAGCASGPARGTLDMDGEWTAEVRFERALWITGARPVVLDDEASRVAGRRLVLAPAPAGAGVIWLETFDRGDPDILDDEFRLVATFLLPAEAADAGPAAAVVDAVRGLPGLAPDAREQAAILYWYQVGPGTDDFVGRPDAGTVRHVRRWPGHAVRGQADVTYGGTRNWRGERLDARVRLDARWGALRPVPLEQAPPDLRAPAGADR